MTEEYKINVLKQLTGQLVEGTSNDEPIFQEDTVTTDTFKEYLISQGYDPTHAFICNFSFTRNNQQLLFYTEYYDGSDISNFILITDDELTPIGLIKNYSSETPFSQWYLPVGNDIGEGRIYFLDEPIPGVERLVYMNDPTIKQEGEDYEVEILFSYTLPITDDYVPRNLMKNQEEGKFVISAFNNTTDKVVLYEFVNNVGVPNEWNIYEYSTAVPGFSRAMSVYPIWSDGLNCRVCFVDTANSIEIKVLKTQNEGGLSLVLDKSIELPTEVLSYTSTVFQLTMKDYNHIYCYSRGLIADNGTSHFYEVDITNGTMNILYTSPMFTNWEIALVNGEIFFSKYYYNINDGKYYVYVGMISKGSYYEEEVDSFDDDYIPLMFVINSYNLYSIKIINNAPLRSRNLYTYYLIYNSLNYNGEAFDGRESVISNSVVLNDENGKPIFARNLYDKTITSNTVESTVEIPAYQLNGINIANQKLISKNSNEIDNQNQSIEKNIYENVLMNFFNTLTIIDNNESKNKVMTNASNYLVNGLENGIYDNFSSIKCKITYTDDSIYKGSIGDVVITDNIATMTFVIYSGVGISKLEIISNDESITYATIEETFDSDSYYRITQEIAIN